MPLQSQRAAGLCVLPGANSGRLGRAARPACGRLEFDAANRRERASGRRMGSLFAFARARRALGHRAVGKQPSDQSDPPAFRRDRVRVADPTRARCANRRILTFIEASAAWS